ncbi:MAG TPA: hypothetical protein PLF21_04800 [Exilispira sp.]|nr:hypothetical protein [Exilispira sp.]
MENILQIIKNSSALTKSLFLTIIGLPIIFLVQLIFYLIIAKWVSGFKKDKNKDNKK